MATGMTFLLCDIVVQKHPPLCFLQYCLELEKIAPKPRATNNQHRTEYAQVYKEPRDPYNCLFNLYLNLFVPSTNIVRFVNATTSSFISLCLLFICVGDGITLFQF